MNKTGPAHPEEAGSPEPGTDRPKPFEAWQDIAARIRSGLNPSSETGQAPPAPGETEPDPGDGDPD